MDLGFEFGLSPLTSGDSWPGSHGLTVGNIGVSWGMFNSGATGELTPQEIDGVAVTDLNSATTTTFTQLRFAGGVQPNGATTYELSVPGFGLVTLPWDGSKYSANVPGFADYLVAQGEGADVPLTPTALTAPTTVNLSDTTIAEDAEVGDLVGIISADGVPAPTYDITSDPDNKFQVNGNRLELAAPVTFPATHNVTLRATNSEGNATQAFAITVTEVIVAPTTLNLDNSTVPETATVGTLIGTFTSNGNGTKTYSKIADPDNKFTITSGGELRLANTVTFPATHSVTCQVSNSAGSYSEAFNITVTEASAEDDRISSLVVSSDGWRATMTVTNAVVGGAYSGLNDFTTPGLVLEVQSKAWTDAGVETTGTRQVIATSGVRKPHPDGPDLEESASGSNLEVIISLSDPIHANDTILSATAKAAFHTNSGAGGGGETNSGGTIATVTNNSTEVWEPVDLTWLTPNKERALTPTFKPRLFVAHSFGSNGRPVRAVKFTASLGGTSVESIVTTMQSADVGAGVVVPFFEPDWNLAAFTDGTTPEINAEAYPWFGEKFDTATDGDTYPSPNICPLKISYLGNGTFSPIYADVGSSAGATPTASPNPATAALPGNEFATIQAAATAAIAVNQTTNSVNNTSGVIIRIRGGVTTQGFGGDGMDGLADGDIPILIEGVNQATSIFAKNASFNDTPGEYVFKNLTYQLTSGFGDIGLNGKNSNDNQVLFDEVNFDANGFSKWGGEIYRTGRQYYNKCTGDDVGQGDIFGATIQGIALNVGSTFVGGGGYNVIGCSTTGLQRIEFLAERLPARNGNTWAYNKMMSIPASLSAPVLADNDGQIGARGITIVGNLVERFGSTINGIMEIAADGATEEAKNIRIFNNTAAGQRCNIGYHDVAGANIKKAAVIANYFSNFNSKADYFTPNDGTRVNNWYVRHYVGGGDNFTAGTQGPGSNPNGGSYDSWYGEAFGDDKLGLPRNSVYGSGANPDFANDQSGTGGSGGGDYTPGASSQLPQVPAARVHYPVDQAGTAIALDGTARAAALQPTS